MAIKASALFFCSLVSSSGFCFLILTLFLSLNAFSYYVFWGEVFYDYISSFSFWVCKPFFLLVHCCFCFCFMLVFFLYSSLLNVVASPIYDYVSAVYEKNIYMESLRIRYGLFPYLCGLLL